MSREIRFTANIFGRLYNVETTDEELIRGCAYRYVGYEFNSYQDGYEYRGKEDFVESLYSDIVNGECLEVFIPACDSTVNMVFDDGIRFLTASRIKEIIGEEYDKVFGPVHVETYP